MKDVYEIRMHGRGGQGAKTAAHILACSALEEKFYIQSFPEFGPERGGAPVKSFIRVSKKPILAHDNVKNPDLVAVIDPTLIANKELILEGLTKNSVLVLNSNRDPDVLKSELGFKGKVFVVDATKISLSCLGRSMPNMPMLGAIIKASKRFTIKGLKKEFEKKFTVKIGKENVQKNLKAMEMAYNEVLGE